MNSADSDPAFEGMKTKVGSLLGTSRWFDVTQDLISHYSYSTRDNDPMHLDEEWSRKNTPFGGTIAAGFWTTSMLIPMSHDIGFIDEYGQKSSRYYALNYGFDHLRLVSPVPVGSRIRSHMSLKDIEDKGEGRTLFHISVEVEVEGAERPALVADWLAMVVRFS